MKAIRLADTRIAAALLAAGLAAFALGCAKAETSVVADVATGAVLSQKDASARMYPASTTKLMTAYVALKAVTEGRARLDSPVIVTRYAASQAPSKMGFEPGSVMRLDNALRMMLVKSANDVAVAIGQSLEGGSIEAFVETMNREAAALGMKDSRFINPNGLPGPGQYSSAKDLAILAAALRREFPALSGFFATEAISAGGAVLRNTNSLLGRFEGADGMKTGYICASGFNLVGSATRNGRTLVAVLLGADGPGLRDRRVAELLEEGFRATPGTGSMTLADLPVAGGPPADISQRICSQAGRTARAKAAKAAETAAKAAGKAGKPPAAAYLSEMTRAPTVVQVGLGGATGNARVAPGISLIAAYGVPIPTFRPKRPEDAAIAATADLRGAAETKNQTAAVSAAPVDLGVTRRAGIPVPTPRVAN